MAGLCGTGWNVFWGRGLCVASCWAKVLYSVLSLLNLRKIKEKTLDTDENSVGLRK